MKTNKTSPPKVQHPHQRKFPRVDLHSSGLPLARLLGAEARVNGGDWRPVFDLSYTGLAVLRSGFEQMRDGDRAVVDLRLSGEPEARVDVRVARSSDSVIAFEFGALATGPRVSLERFLQAKLIGLHMRAIDPKVFHQGGGPDGAYTHWFQGPNDSSIVLWYDGLELRRATVEMGDSWLRWEAGPQGGTLREGGFAGKKKASLKGVSPFVARVVDMLIQVPDSEKVLAPLIRALTDIESAAA